jgi:hypothetical protein
MDFGTPELQHFFLPGSAEMAGLVPQGARLDKALARVDRRAS